MSMWWVFAAVIAVYLFSVLAGLGLSYGYMACCDLMDFCRGF